MMKKLTINQNYSHRNFHELMMSRSSGIDLNNLHETKKKTKQMYP